MWEFVLNRNESLERSFEMHVSREITPPWETAREPSDPELVGYIPRLIH